jgi:hypothetical protein
VLAAPEFGGKDQTKSVPPEPDRLMRDIDAALMQQVLDVPQRQRVTDIHHHRQADDLGRRLETTQVEPLRHDADLPAPPFNRQPDFPVTVPSSDGAGIHVGQAGDPHWTLTSVVPGRAPVWRRLPEIYGKQLT